jgi:penicillin-binding protein 2
LLRPRIVKKVESWDGKILLESEPEVLHTVEFHSNNLEIVQNSLEAVVNEPHGTGWAARLDQVRVAGKTGTAQVVRRRADDEEPEEEGTPYRFRDHALFVAYAPAEDPRIAVAVVVEHGEHGSTTAAPVARSILQAFFKIPGDSVSPVNGYPGD